MVPNRASITYKICFYFPLLGPHSNKVKLFVKLNIDVMNKKYKIRLS